MISIARSVGRSIFTATIFQKLAASPSIVRIALPAVTFLIGLQLLRVVLPGLTWTLADRWIQAGFGAREYIILLIIAVSLASAIFLLHRVADRQRLIIVTSAGVGLTRLLVQIQWPDPLVNLGIAIHGTVLLLVFLSVYLAEARLNGSRTVEYFALGLLAGLLLDTAIHGAFDTYDSAWQSGLLAFMVTAVLVLLQWVIAISCWMSFHKQKYTENMSTGQIAWPLIAIGPFLFVELVIYQNIGRFAAITDATLHLSFFLVLLAQTVAIFAATIFLKIRTTRSLLLVLLVGSLAVIAAVFSDSRELWIAALTVIVGQASLSILMVVTVVSVSMESSGRRFLTTARAGTLGMILFMFFCISYYLVYLINLPYENTVLKIAAAAMVALFASISSRVMSVKVLSRSVSLLLPLVMVLLLLVPLVGAITSDETEEMIGEGFPVRVMTYNLHNGFSNMGDLEMEALAQTIEDQAPDIVVLQEVSRGWLISGRLDMITWLSERLNMNYVFGPTADPLWGSAILSRYPVVEFSNHDLPPRNLYLLRGFISAEIDIGGNEYLNLIATHFHHVVEDSNTRIPQAHSIVDFWNGTSRTVLLGDLNADPDTPEMKIIEEAGLLDTMGGKESSSIFTFHSTDPNRRIDYIWISPDLIALNTYVPFSNASDHLPVVAVIGAH